MTVVAAAPSTLAASAPMLVGRLTGAAAGLAVVGAVVVHALAIARRQAARHHLDRQLQHRERRRRDGALPPSASANARFGALVPPIPGGVARRLRRAGLGVGAADRLWRWATVGIVTAVGAATAVGGPGGAALVVLAVGLGLGSAALAVGDRAAVLVDRELPNVLATIAAGLRSGASLTVAVREGAGRARGPAADDLTEVVDSLSAGRGLVEVLDTWVRARPTPGVRMAGAALALAAETGGAGARTIDGVAATLRDRLAVEQELAALSSQARASAVVIGVAPLGFVVLTATSDPGIWDFFLRTPAGLACLAAGSALDAAGASWMMLVARGGAMTAASLPGAVVVALLVPTVASGAAALAGVVALAAAGRSRRARALVRERCTSDHGRSAPARTWLPFGPRSRGSGDRSASPARWLVALDVGRAAASVVGAIGRRVAARPADSDADVRLGAGVLLLAVIVIGAGVPAPAAVVAAFATWAVPVVRQVRRRARDRSAVVDELPEVVDLVRLGVGSGLNIRLSLDAVVRHREGRIAAALREALTRVDRGERLADSLDAMVTVDGAVRPLIDALVATERYGAPLVSALDRVASEARTARRRRREQAARRVPVKLLFPLVFCTLPAFALLTVVPVLLRSVPSLAP